MKLKAEKNFLNSDNKMILRGTIFEGKNEKEEEILVRTKLASVVEIPVKKSQEYETKIVEPKIQKDPAPEKIEPIIEKIEIKSADETIVEKEIFEPTEEIIVKPKRKKSKKQEI